jgi:Zn-dependent protease with chaperone function
VAFDINAIRHSKERIYGPATLCAGAALWALAALLIVLGKQPLVMLMVMGLYTLLIWGVLTATRALVRAYMFGHHVLVGPDQFPHIHAMVEEGANKLGLEAAPQTFVYNSHGVMNAFALRLLGKTRYIWLTSALIDADNEEQLRFVIGHELGHHIAGHLDEMINLLRLPALMVPFLGAAYSRSRELTCDRIGAYITRDLNVARSALQMLACGSAKLNSQMNGAAFALQDKMVPPLAGLVLKAFSSYPRLTRRVEEVSQWLIAQGLGRSQPASTSAKAA